MSFLKELKEALFVTDVHSRSERKAIRVRHALQRSRRECQRHGHDWDIADVMVVLTEEGLL